MNQITPIQQLKSWEPFIDNGDELLWTSKPNLQSPFRFLWEDGDQQSFTLDGKTLMAILIFMAMCSCLLYLNDELFLMLLGNALVFLPLLTFAFYQRYKANFIFYAITKKQVLFKTKIWFKTIVHKLPMTEIIAVNLLKREDGNGTLEIVNQHPLPFKSYHHNRLQLDPYPTLDSVHNVDRALQLIERGIKHNPPLQLIREPSVFDKLKTLVLDKVDKYLAIATKFSHKFVDRLKRHWRILRDHKKTRVLYILQLLAIPYALATFQFYIIPFFTSYEIIEVFHAIIFMVLGLCLLSSLSFIKSQKKVDRFEIYSIFILLSFVFLVYLAAYNS